MMSIKKIFFFLFFGAIILCPLVFFDFSSGVSSENRMKEKFPEFPAAVSDLKTFTGRFETWFNDRIGFRQELISFYNKTFASVFGVSPVDNIALGKNGTVFLTAASHAKVRHDDILSAFGGEQDWENSVKLQKKLIEDAWAWIGEAGVKTLFLAVPTSPVLRFGDLPDFLQKMIDKKKVENPPITEALNNFLKEHPPAVGSFLYPLEEAVRLSKLHHVYPQKNFHWSVSPFTVLVAGRLAELLGDDPPRPSSGDAFRPCVTTSDLSHLMGFVMHNENDLCPTEEFLHEFPLVHYNFKSPPPSLSLLGDLQAAAYWANEKGIPKNILVIGDSFNAALGLPLSRIYKNVLTVDYWGIERQHKDQVETILRKIRDEFQPDAIIFVSHNYFWPIARPAFKSLKSGNKKHLHNRDKMCTRADYL
ncbi:hypothetical protein [Desulfovibrio sp. ZJ200]|uniref:hypothetical protein n=1 Tax=Desulfovibrio sp. ZJ200 TaxID=2709792 RepID=UPI0013EE0CF5|nr:hypothetical protein [Desulfovibrio sp. ZJ200]